MIIINLGETSLNPTDRTFITFAIISLNLKNLQFSVFKYKMAPIKLGFGVK
jgi:hypothetical protein